MALVASLSYDAAIRYPAIAALVTLQDLQHKGKFKGIGTTHKIIMGAGDAEPEVLLNPARNGCRLRLWVRNTNGQGAMAVTGIWSGASVFGAVAGLVVWVFCGFGHFGLLGDDFRKTRKLQREIYWPRCVWSCSRTNPPT